MIKAQFDQLYEEGAESGRVMCVPLHPFLVGQPHRLAAFAKALDYVTSHDRVWVIAAELRPARHGGGVRRPAAFEQPATRGTISTL